MPLAEGLFVSSNLTAMGNIAKPGCQTQCGNLTVKYPFGIGDGCFLDESFQLTCNDTKDPPKLFIGSENIQIYNISDSELRISNSIAFKCYNKSGVSEYFSGWYDFEGSPFTFSQKNKLNVVGCDDIAWFKGRPNGSSVEFTSGCSGFCSEESDVHNGNCSGIGCCQTTIPKGLQYYRAELQSVRNHTGVIGFNPCGFAFLSEESSFQFGGATTCKGNSSCNDADVGGYSCSCNKGYDGNPYLDPGCQDINECTDKSNFPCYGNCINTPGSYNCTCFPGHTGNATTLDGCRSLAEDSKFPVVVFVVAVITGICFRIRKRKQVKPREKLFEQNGGVFLKQKLRATGGNDAVTMFSTEELRKATDNYSEDQIIGRGGSGVVYKGTLSDNRVVAIKKSKLVDRTQAEQFINEVFILTQVIHRNVVKLLGCCLEEEVPVLVYEYISNNTLYYHIHHRSGGMNWLSWENRLRVAVEAATALAYLHSQASMPIIHRDVKSANILLDDNYTTKVSDFGASRLIPLDQDQVMTLVHGTLGYLDPEYFQTSQLTDKSDVYSFGVVLVELLTGKKPICASRSYEEKNLATYFDNSMKENRFLQIVEPRLLHEGTLEQVQAVAEIAKRCLNEVGEHRPAMKEVAMELDGLRKFTTI
ncbi:unnamed protein product [Lactuca virosa]|uniref:Protein kinase domain-containing protein n=1 Tax=Lactuca virosa TaxID=75947 RepID=A0AAU9MQ62_9ASTR|nr:unnamed protein product [Lactuca virosa]